MNDQIIIVQDKMIYLHEKPEHIQDGILENVDLRHSIQSDYPFDWILGPVRVHGQP